MKVNPWPWAITILCVSAFAAATTVVVVMVRQNVELVTPDYYAQDLRHQERMDQERLARDNPATFEMDPAGGRIMITFPGAEVTGRITLYRPSDLSLDRSLDIAVDVNNRQTISTASLASGLWRVRLQWEAEGDSYYQEETVTLP